MYDWIIYNTSYEYGGYGNYLSVDCVINDKIDTCRLQLCFYGNDALSRLRRDNGKRSDPQADGGYTGHQWFEVTIGSTAYVFAPQVEDNIAGRNNGKIQYQRFCKTYEELKDKYKK